MEGKVPCSIASFYHGGKVSCPTKNMQCSARWFKPIFAVKIWCLRYPRTLQLRVNFARQVVFSLLCLGVWFAINQKIASDSQPKWLLSHKKDITFGNELTLRWLLLSSRSSLEHILDMLGRKKYNTITNNERIAHILFQLIQQCLAFVYTSKARQIISKEYLHIIARSLNDSVLPVFIVKPTLVCFVCYFSRMVFT